MRFQKKFGFEGWLWVLVAFGWGFLLVVHRHFNVFEYLMAAVWTILGLLNVLSLRYIYWELDASSLRIHRFGGMKEIVWDQVTKVSSWYPEYISKEFIEIRYVYFASELKQSSIIAKPSDSEKFLETIRQFVPKAKVNL